MKIAFLVDVFPKLSETFILNQITGLLDMGHDLEIFAKFNPGESKIHPDVERYRLMETVPYYDMPKGWTRRLFKAIYLLLLNFGKSPRKLIKSLNFVKYGRKALSLNLFYALIPFLRKDFDIIHCHFGPNGNLGILLRELGAVKGKIITTFHGWDATGVSPEHGGIYDALFSEGDLFTVNTKFTASQIMALGCDQEKIVILPVGLRLERFKFKERKISIGEKVKLLTVARLVEEKGHAYAIRAIARLIKKNDNIAYIIAGDGPLRKELQLLSKETGVEDYVEFLGNVDEGEAARLYAEAHLFILPSVTSCKGNREAQGLVLQEAQASGLPVISTLLGGIPDGIYNGHEGFLVPEKNADALAERIEYLLEHPTIWPEIGRQGRMFVEKKYDINTLNQKLIGIYEALLAKQADALRPEYSCQPQQDHDVLSVRGERFNTADSIR